MPTPVVMPQMGESIAEGTIVRWIKRVGEAVERDEPLFEISTDKVDAEIPAPTAGVVAVITVQEGETVPVGSVVAMIRHADEGGAAEDVAVDEPPEAVETPSGGAAPGAGARRERQARTSPLVRRLAREHGLELSGIAGSGRGGRVTKRDVLDHLARRDATAAPAGGDVDIVPMSPMRKKIAEHMVLSRRTSAHAHTVFEADFTRVVALRDAWRADYQRQGARLTYLAFIAHAVVGAIREVPIINSSLDGENIVYRRAVNLGIAVALDQGLIVPVVHGAQDKRLLELSRAIADLAARARAKQLSPDEVQGGTFTITNHGVSGGLFGTPIINQPQVAILGVGVVQKRAVVIDDQVVARPMAYLTLGFDHRIIDGATAERFMSALKRGLEAFAEG